MSGIISEVLSQTEAVPFTVIGDKKVYTFDELKKANNRQLAEEKLIGKIDSFDQRRTRENGSCYMKTKAQNVGVNLDFYCSNRYRKIKQGNRTVYEVVTDYRAIKEQSSDRVYTNSIVVHTIGQDKKELVYLGTKNISDIEFINEFKNKLKNEDMLKIAEVILKNQEQKGVSGDSLVFD